MNYEINKRKGFEVDFLPVGEGERSGDAIALRFGNLFGSRDEQKVVVVDGGTKESGERLVNHIKGYYKTDLIDIVISTHPDEDHVSGLTEVIKKMKVKYLLMHRPWEHAGDIKKLLKERHITSSGLEAKIEKSLEQAYELETLASQKRVPIYEPFQGISALNGAMRILSPTKPLYELLLSNFRVTPEPKKEFDILKHLKKAKEEVVSWIEDRIDFDLLDDIDRTTPENNSSTITLLSIYGSNLLFTGDAGITALTTAADYAQKQGIDLTNLTLLSVPHHGSKRNVGSTILKWIKAKNAFVLASKEGAPKHPAKKVTNAFIKHGSRVYATQGRPILHGYNAPDRGWITATPLPFYERVEG